MKNLSDSILNLISYSTEKRFIVLLILISFLIKVIFAYIFIKYPDIPHDFYAYIDGGNLLLEGKPLYQTPISNEKIFLYGPLFAALMGGWMAIFGINYFLLKFPCLIFSGLTIIPFFYLVRNVSNTQIAKYLSIIFSFSYITLFSSGFLGNDDEIFVFFMVLSIYFLFTIRYKLSALSLAIATGFKVVPLILFPAIIIYFYRTCEVRQIAKYIFVFTISFLIILFPFYLNSGISVLYPYIGAPNFQTHVPTAACLSPLNLIRTGIGICQNAIYYFSTHSMIPYDQNPLKNLVACPLNMFFNKIATPYAILGFILIFIYIFKFRIKEEKLEFTRNSFLFIFGGLFFSKLLDDLYFFWFFPFFLLLLSFKGKEWFKSCILSRSELYGILLVVITLLFHAVNNIHYSFQTQERIFLLLCCFLVGIGTYLMFFRIIFKKVWSIFVFIGILWRTTAVINPLLIFKPILIKFIPDTPIGPYETYLSYSTRFALDFVTILMMTIAMVWFMIEIHKYLKDDYYTAPTK